MTLHEEQGHQTEKRFRGLRFLTSPSAGSSCLRSQCQAYSHNLSNELRREEGDEEREGGGGPGGGEEVRTSGIGHVLKTKQHS